MTRPTLARVPNQPKTPLHSFRIDDERWEAAKAKAKAEGITLADVLRDAVDRYLRKAAR